MQMLITKLKELIFIFQVAIRMRTKNASLHLSLRRQSNYATTKFAFDI